MDLPLDDLDHREIFCTLQGLSSLETLIKHPWNMLIEIEDLLVKHGTIHLGYTQ